MSSRSYTNLIMAVGGKDWLKKAIGCSFCKRTAPMLYPEALVSSTKGLEKLGRAKMGMLAIAVFRV